MNDFITFEFIGTFAGMVTLVSFTTQYLKNIIRKIPAQLLSYILALILILLVTLVNSGFANWQALILSPFNAAIVSLTSNGAYTAITRNNSKSTEVNKQ